VVVIPNAVDLERFDDQTPPDPELRRRLGLEGATVLGFLGSFYAYEGLELLVEALPAILAQEPRARLLLVGGGPRREALEAAVERLGLEDKVIFTGRVPHEEVAGYYRLVDILVYPRRSMRLTDLVTPLKPLEAMAQGKLVLASDVGGHRELIRDGWNGVLFRAGDPAALAEAALDLMSRRGEWDRFRANGRRFVEEERNWPRSVGRYQALYERVLGERGGQGR